MCNLAAAASSLPTCLPPLPCRRCCFLLCLAVQVLWNESLIQRARNTLAMMFMDNPVRC